MATPPKWRLANKRYVPIAAHSEVVVRAVLHMVYQSKRLASLIERSQNRDQMRQDARRLAGRSVRSMESRAIDAPKRQILIRLPSGREIPISGLVATSTYYDFHMEVRRVLGIPLRATSTSIAIIFNSSCCPECGFQEKQIIPCGDVLCKRALRGCVFDVILHQ